MRIVLGGNSDIAKAIMGIKVTREMCDVTNYNEVIKFLKENNASEVVNCAGVIYPAPIRYSLINNWKKEIEVNLIASYYVAKACCELNAKMVFIGSTSGLKGRAGWSGYCASKAGLISLVQSLAEEGFDAWCINPSRTATKMRKKLFPNDDSSTLLKPSDIAIVVEKCFDGKYKSGSNITIKKNNNNIIEEVR
jgi:3-oxoacyl-[acyl-carrier protein] reductase